MFKFNHEAENLPRALSISEETEHKVEEMVFYSAASNHLLGKDSLNNAMSVFTLMSGILIKNN